MQPNPTIVQRLRKGVFVWFKNGRRAGAMAQGLRAITAHPEDLGLVPAPTSIGFNSL